MRATERALRAPSVHNSQPWQWQIVDDLVRLYGDPNRHLVGTDPERRDLVISCGAALHHLRVALADLDVPTTTQRLPDPEDSTHLAIVRTVDGPINIHDAALADAIDERRSDRRAFREEPAQPALPVNCPGSPRRPPGPRVRQDRDQRPSTRGRTPPR